jgi:hypothetical protein
MAPVNPQDPVEKIENVLKCQCKVEFKIFLGVNWNFIMQIYCIEMHVLQHFLWGQLVERS